MPAIELAMIAGSRRAMYSGNSGSLVQMSTDSKSEAQIGLEPVFFTWLAMEVG